jgi:hypothetical protein
LVSATQALIASTPARTAPPMNPLWPPTVPIAISDLVPAQAACPVAAAVAG